MGSSRKDIPGTTEHSAAGLGCFPEAFTYVLERTLVGTGDDSMP